MSKTISRRVLPALGRHSRKPIVVKSRELASFSFLGQDHSLPLVVSPQNATLNLSEWVAEQRDALRDHLCKYGALLFRGFQNVDVTAFEKTIAALSGDPLPYLERTSPRHAVHGNIYTSTDYPQEFPIFLHNEQSYGLNWCQKISFFCKRQPSDRGQTPIADTRKILARIDPEVLRRIKQTGYMYMRNFRDGMGLPWQVAYQTQDCNLVEAHCRRNDIHWEWKAQNRLQTWQIRPVIRHHPVSGEAVWFNHCTFFHISTIPEKFSKYLISSFQDRDLPNQTFYGDGKPFEPEVIRHLQECYLAEKVIFDWREGDVLVLDNMLTAHGREPFSGEREILAALSEPTQNPEIGTESENLTT